MSGTAARRALFEAERGVCQLCSVDAHSLFLSIRALHVRDRPAYLAQTPYASLPQQTLKKMVMEPKEGMVRELYQNIASGKKRRRLGRAGLCFFFFCQFFCLPSSLLPIPLAASPLVFAPSLARSRALPNKLPATQAIFLEPTALPQSDTVHFSHTVLYSVPLFPPFPMKEVNRSEKENRSAKW